MTDYISRADAIAEFAEWVKKANENGETPTWNDAVSLIGSLPSADAVSRDVHVGIVNELVKRIEELKADFVKVVRCKDCRHYTEDVWKEFGGTPIIVAHQICDFWADGCKTDPNGYCSYGERAEQTDYKLPDYDEIMEKLDKLTLKGGDNNV